MFRCLKTLVAALVAVVMAVGELRDAEAQEHVDPALEERTQRCQRAALMRLQSMEMGSYRKLDRWGLVGRVNYLISALIEGGVVTQFWGHVKDRAENGTRRLIRDPQTGRLYGILMPDPNLASNWICGLRDYVERAAERLQLDPDYKRGFEYWLKEAEEYMEEDIKPPLEKWVAGFEPDPAIR